MIPIGQFIVSDRLGSRKRRMVWKLIDYGTSEWKISSLTSLKKQPVIISTPRLGTLNLAPRAIQKRAQTKNSTTLYASAFRKRRETGKEN